MVDFDDLGGPRGSLGALGSVLGGPGSSRVGFWRARGSPEKQGTAFGGSREGSGNPVWRSQVECICARYTSLQVFLLIFENNVFSNVSKHVASTFLLSRVFLRPVGPWALPGEHINFFFWPQGGPLEQPKLAP